MFWFVNLALLIGSAAAVWFREPFFSEIGTVFLWLFSISVIVLAVIGSLGILVLAVGGRTNEMKSHNKTVWSWVRFSILQLMYVTLAYFVYWLNTDLSMTMVVGSVCSVIFMAVHHQSSKKTMTAEQKES